MAMMRQRTVLGRVFILVLCVVRLQHTVRPAHLANRSRTLA